MILTVTNTGTASYLNISSFVLSSSDFAVSSNTCTAALPVTTPPSNCTISVTFTPPVPGSSVGSLTLTDNAPNSPQIVLLEGNGVQPAVSLSTTILSFGSQTVNITSPAQTVMVTNTGTVPLVFTSISPTTGFGQTNTCSAPVPPAGTCLIGVTFTPTVAGTLAGSITLTDNAGNSPQTIALNGTGVACSLISNSFPRQCDLCHFPGGGDHQRRPQVE